MLMKKKPRYLFYQNAKELQGRREVDGYDWRSNIFREGNEFLRFNYRSLGFNELDEYVLSIGRLPHAYNPSYDGWHIFGTIRKMEVIVLINMLCNQYNGINSTSTSNLISRRYFNSPPVGGYQINDDYINFMKNLFIIKCNEEGLNFEYLKYVTKSLIFGSFHFIDKTIDIKNKIWNLIKSIN
jgi:hypothetical protein